MVFRHGFERNGSRLYGTAAVAAGGKSRGTATMNGTGVVTFLLTTAGWGDAPSFAPVEYARGLADHAGLSRTRRK